MQPTATVLVYSDDSNTREQVRLAAGRRPASDVPAGRVRGVRDPARRPRASWSKGGIDVCVLDGEAVPAGGMGVCRQIKDEIFECPPGAAADRAARRTPGWRPGAGRRRRSTQPVDPVALAGALAGLLRRTAGR